MRDDAGRVGEWRRSNEAPAEPAAAACAGSDYLMPAAYYGIPLDALNDVLDAYCIDRQSNDLKLGNLSLEGFDVRQADSAREGREDDPEAVGRDDAARRTAASAPATRCRCWRMRSNA
jgi:hypothetical protein